jgi:SAM-dependent methyltransferase
MARPVNHVVCTICKKPIPALERGDHCPSCKSPARTRSLPIVLSSLVKPNLKTELASDKPLLAFAVTGAERTELTGAFPKITSVSLFGDYGSGHTEGVDVRDLSRYPDGSFCGVFSILLFDYFVEMERGLAECARVLAPGGMFFTAIGHYRLVDGEFAPAVQNIIKRTDTYFHYVPEGAELANIKVGRQTFVNAMHAAGIEGGHHQIWDEAAGTKTDWFVGQKMATPAVRALAAALTPDAAPWPRAAPVAPVAAVAPAAQVAAASTAPPKAPAATPPGVVRTIGLPLKSLMANTPGRTASPYHLTLKLSLPKLPIDAISDASFGEHVFDVKTRAMTPQVIFLGYGRVMQSMDNGETWRIIPLPDTEGRPLIGSFTTSDGNHIIQANEEVQDPRSDSPRLKDRVLPLQHSRRDRATLFVYNKDWKLLKIDDTPRARWHGRCSIDERDGTIMMGEYHDNVAKYVAEFSSERTKWFPHMQPNAIWRSRDGGLSWTKVFEQDGDGIRHFHTCAADPLHAKTWWASSGDRAEESRVWRSTDDGDTWREVTNPVPDVVLPRSLAKRKQLVFRYTDLVFAGDDLIWGADDCLGSWANNDPDLPRAERSGSRLYRAKRADVLQPEELGFVGHPIRSIVDAGPCYIVITEANRGRFPLRAQMLALFKDDLYNPIELAQLDNFRNNNSGVTYSKASRMAYQNRFFCFRNMTDVFDSVRPNALQCDIAFKD